MLDFSPISQVRYIFMLAAIVLSC